MRDRVQAVWNHYFKPVPKPLFKLIDSMISAPPPEDSEQAQLERDSIDIYIYLVV
jgi:hypothetical protein